MIVLGTKPQYINAPWVRNEWERFIHQINQGADKKIVVLYKDFDPYLLPEKLKQLQGINLGEMTALSEILSLADISINKPVSNFSAQTEAQPSVNSLLARATMFMEYNNWKDADIYCEKVLDVEPTNPTAYLYKLLIECKAVSIDELSQKAILIERSANCKKAVNFSDNFTKEKLDLCRKQCIYNTASDTAKRTNNYSGYIDAMQIFASISGFSDSEKQKRVCVDKAKECLTSKINQSKYVFTMHNDSLRQLEEKTAELHKEKQKHQISVQDLEKMNKKLANTRKWTIAYCVLWILSFALSAIITIAHDEPLTFSTVFWAGLLFFAIPGTCILGFIKSICDKSAKKKNRGKQKHYF